MIDKKVITVILGGGKGTRLNPLTENRSKPAVPIAGKYRLVDIPISNCLHSNFKRIFILTQYNSASLNAHIKNTYNFDVFSKGFVNILAAEQTSEGDKWFQGTADAVRKVRRHLEGHEFEYILILSGDQLYQMDLEKLIGFHETNKAEITLATIPVNAKDATSFGILKSDSKNIITSFIEKPDAELLPDWKSDVGLEMEGQGRRYLASMGIYVFNKDVLLGMLENNKGVDFGKELIPAAIGSLKVASYQFEGYWTDIGSIDSFFEANLGLTEDLPKFDFFNKEIIYTRPRMLPASKFAGVSLDRVIVSDGCIVHADKVERSIIGVRSRVGQGTVIRNTYMMGSDYYQTLEEMSKDSSTVMGVGERCYIENAILDKNCCIGNDVRIMGGTHLKDEDFATHTIRDGIVVVKRSAKIKDGTVIGCSRC